MTTTDNEQLRENLIQTAVKFLTNPNVQRCTIDSRENFLRAKGLSDAEIQKAFQTVSEQLLTLPSKTPDFFFLGGHSRTSWFKEKVLPVIVYAGFAYGAYWFYKNVIRNLIFVEKPQEKTAIECLEEVKQSLASLNNNILSLRSDLETLTNQQSLNNLIRTQLDTVKTDINSVKGILLNRSQFPSIKTRPEPPSIPAWQRQGEEASSDADHGNEDKPKSLRGRTQRSASGGSNSSEGDVNTKNSDSSLEIIS